MKTTFRILCAIASITTASATFAENDYPYPNANIYNPSNPSDPTTIDPWRFYNRECTSFVAWRMNRDAGTTSLPYYFFNYMSGGHWGDASNWANNATTLGFPVDTVPKVGAIAQWNASEVPTRGHVAYVEQVNGDGSVNVSEYNYSSAYKYNYDTRNNLRPPRFIHVAQNPPYCFDTSAQGWSSGHSLTPVVWTGTSPWPGIIYADQNGDDSYFSGPDTRYTGLAYPSVNVSVYPQNGTTDSHNMQMFYRTAAENSYAPDKSSPVVLYRLQNNWARINLDFNGSYLKYYNQTITGLRLDVDEGNSSTRWIVNHIIPQSSLRWDFSSDAQGWSSANSLSPVSWTSDATWPGVIHADQTGNDPRLVSASGLQMYGGINDRVHVRVYPQGGSTANHEMQVFFTTGQDNSFSEDKSLMVYYTAKDEWADVYFDFGVTNKWNGNFNKGDFIRQIRLDLDGVNHGNHWIIDYVRVEHKTDASSIAAPTIGQHPASQTANQGDTVTFSVYANGHAPFNYQWQKNGVNISGKTGFSLTLANVQTGDAASYACLVSNAGGSVTSGDAILTVNPVTYTITVSAAPTAGGTVSGGGTFPAGSSRTVTASANSGYTFVNWTESGTPVSSSASYPFTLNGNRTLVANFTANPVNYTITVSAAPTAGGTVSGGGTFPAGSSRTVTASANSGYTFVNWTESGTPVSSSASYPFTLNGNRTLVANFMANPVNYTITVSASPSAGGTVSGGGTFPAGSSRTVTASANSGYTFVNWTESGTSFSSSASYPFTLNGNRTLVANFTANPVNYTITVSAAPTAGGTVSGG
ncbi:MAG: CHAP domain-containing protein, partial [Verrucomicrobiota bacterium]